MATLAPPVMDASSTGATQALLPVYKRAPMVLVRGDGVRLFDADGNEYIDFTSGIAVNALGYGDPDLQAALHRAADGLIHVSNLFRTEPGERLAERLVARSFADRVFFCNSGVEANEGAFKFARRWARSVGGPAKHEIVGLRGRSMAGSSRAWRRPIAPHTGPPFAPSPEGSRSRSGTWTDSPACSPPRPRRRS